MAYTKKEQKAYVEGLERSYNQGKREKKDDVLAGIFIGVGIGIVIVMVSWTIVFWGDDVDVIRTNEFGRLACEGVGLTYSHRTWHQEVTEVPVIHCRDPNKTIMDGVIVRG